MSTSKKKKPTKAEIAKLRKAVNAVTKEFFKSYGGKGGYNYLLVGPGPIPPPKLEIDILNLATKD
ncbi:MAG TPA: hypothetical protein VK624_15660 [Steroidobacteraceae bacterium]|jgi:hypothetical protein|nr:hypothetical protein [Steroidobacteraceae bacterium]